MFKSRSLKLERIDTGDYTASEYSLFLREISFINRYLGDERALKKSLFHDIERDDVRDFSVLDVGAGSGELLRSIAKFAAASQRSARLAGIDLNETSAAAISIASPDLPNITAVRGDALHLPFADGSFDYVISSLFFHHLTDENAVAVLKEMRRVARRGIYVIDLHRHPLAYAGYKIFCAAFGISKLVREDGSLSILRGFKAMELRQIAERAGMTERSVTRSTPFRLVLTGR